MFVTASDFDLLPYSIPNLDKVVNSFAAYVDAKEKAMLQKLLGRSLYKSFIDGLAADPIEQCWIDLVDGADYLLSDGKTYHWNGLVSMLKPFIYSEWLRDTFDTHSGIGIVVGNAENSLVQNPSRRIAESWNEFARQTGTYFNNSNNNYYNGFYLDVGSFWYWDSGNCVYDLRDTLYGYLKQTGISGTFDDSFDSTFTDFQAYLNFWFTDPGTKNVFNI